MTRETTSSGAEAPTGLVPHLATATRRATGGVGGALCRPLSSDEASPGKLWIRERFMRAGSARDDRASASRRAQTGEQKSPFAGLLACGSRLISRAESAREAGGQPAVVCAKTDNK